MAAGARRYVAESHFLVYGSGDLGEAPLTEDVATLVRPPAAPCWRWWKRWPSRSGPCWTGAADGTIEGVVLRLGDPYRAGAGTAEIARVLPIRRQRLPVADSLGGHALGARRRGGGADRGGSPPDLRHPFGYGAEVYFWSLLAALGIFLTGGTLSVWEGVEQFLHPHEAANFVYGHVVLGFGYEREIARLVATRRPA